MDCPEAAAGGRGTGALAALFDPAVVAVVGASADPGKWGHHYAKALLKGQDRRRVFLVNARAARVLDQPAYPRCIDLPLRPELAVLCVPVERTEDAVQDALAAGAQFIVCVTAGFAELGAEGRARQDRLVQAVRAAGARLVGPNCYGIIDYDSELECRSFWTTARGSVGLVSQSGTVLLEFSSRCADHGLGLSRAVSMGNQADLSAAEFVESFEGHRSTRALVVYLEEIKAGRALFGALQRQVNAGRDCILLAPGAHAATSRAVASHTGSMLSGDEAIDAACEDIGVVRVRSVAAAVRAIRGILAPARSRGRRVAVVADGGGAAVLAADACVVERLEVPAFSAGLQSTLRGLLQPGAGAANPVDGVGALCLADLQPAIEAIVSSKEVDAVLIAGAMNNVGRVTEEADRASVAAVLARATAAGQGLAVATFLPQELALREFAALGVPVSTDAVECAQILRDGAHPAGRRKLPEEPAPAAATGAAAAGYFASRSLFESLGVPFPRAEEVRSEDEAVAAATRIGYPVAVKALGLLHKSDAGGVALALQDADAVREKVRDMTGRLAPPSFSVEANVPTAGGVELLVGCVRHPGLGPVVAVGLGGTLTEILQDTVVALAPVDAAYAEGMLRRLKGARLLEGFRGKAAVDVAACARVIAGFSTVLFRHPDLAEAEINPLLATARGAMALDARVVGQSAGPP